MFQQNQQAQALRKIPGRNATCFCGSGKKFKHCCLKSPAIHVAQPLTSLATSLDSAKRKFAAGELAFASALLHQVLAAESENADALHFLGLIAHQQGDSVGALSLLNRSLLAAPRNAAFFMNVGVVLKGSGDTDRSIEFFRRAVQLDPKLANTHFNLGTALLQKKDYPAAARTLTEAVRLQPDSPETINSLGVTLMHLGSHERAIICYRKALELDPKYVPAYSNLGSSLSALGRHQEAVEALQQALQYDPKFEDAHINLANALRYLARYEEAIASSERALALRPDDVEALLNLGNAYKERGQLALAEQAYRQAIYSNPSDPRAYSNCAEALYHQGRPAEAAKMYELSLQAQPGFATAYSNLLYLHAFTRDVTPAEELQIARGWERAVVPEAERVAARTAASPKAGMFSNLPAKGRQLRIGIVSAELGSHAVAEFLQPLLENLDRKRFHLTLFPTVNRWENRGMHLRSLADNCVPLAGMPDAAAVECIRHEHIDVLMDTSGHTSSNRLGIFARRAAPVQCTYIGYWSTTGLTEMDWFISDPAAPKTAERGFSEGLWRLPRISVCYHGDQSLGHDQWKPDPSGTVWLGSFNKYAKIREETLELWAKVLHTIPAAKLLLEDRGTHEEESQKRICDGLRTHGTESDRVNFIPYMPGHERHMLLYNRLDIALDTIPFNSGTTAFDALWMGVPLVALEGDWIGGCMGASVLSTLGRHEWIAKTHEEYVSIVRLLAEDISLRTKIRATQRQQMVRTELFDAPGLTRALEDSFLGMYEHWLRS